MIPCGDEDDLLILIVGSCRSAIFGDVGEDVGPRDHERPAEPVVEALRQVAGQLQVLALVLADGNLVGLVQQDVGGLQDRVGEQPHAGHVRAGLGRLVLELDHPAGLAEPGQAAEHPGELGVLGHVALHEHGAAVRVEPGAEQLCGGDPGPAAQQRRVLRHGDRVQVDDAVERVVAVLQRHPLAQRAQVVAEMERVGGGLDTGQHSGSGHARNSSYSRGAAPPGDPRSRGHAPGDPPKPAQRRG